MCRQTNVIATYSKNILDFALGSLSALIGGFHLAYGYSALGFHPGDTRELELYFNFVVVQATAAVRIRRGSSRRRKRAPRPAFWL
jgi:ammonia channel protein AmtB